MSGEKERVRSESSAVEVEEVSKKRKPRWSDGGAGEMGRWRGSGGGGRRDRGGRRGRDVSEIERGNRSIRTEEEEDGVMEGAAQEEEEEETLIGWHNCIGQSQDSQQMGTAER